MAGIAYKPLTVDVHEPGFVAKIAQENQFGPWYLLSDDDKRQVGAPWGPANPQALNRYSYVLNNPMKWTDPGGHTWYLGKQEAADLIMFLKFLQTDTTMRARVAEGGEALSAYLASAIVASGAPPAVAGLGIALILAYAAQGISFELLNVFLGQFIALLERANSGDYGVAIAMDAQLQGYYILDRSSGSGWYYTPGLLFLGVNFSMPRSLIIGGMPVVLDKEHPDWWNQYHWSQDEKWVRSCT